MAAYPVTFYDHRKSRRLALLCFKYTDSKKKSVVLSSDFVAANLQSVCSQFLHSFSAELSPEQRPFSVTLRCQATCKSLMAPKFAHFLARLITIRRKILSVFLYFDINLFAERAIQFNK